MNKTRDTARLYGPFRWQRKYSHLLESPSNNNGKVVVPLKLLDEHGIHAFVVRGRVRHTNSLDIEVLRKSDSFV